LAEGRERSRRRRGGPWAWRKGEGRGSVLLPQGGCRASPGGAVRHRARRQCVARLRACAARRSHVHTRPQTASSRPCVNPCDAHGCAAAGGDRGPSSRRRDAEPKSLYTCLCVVTYPYLYTSRRPLLVAHAVALATPSQPLAAARPAPARQPQRPRRRRRGRRRRRARAAARRLCAALRGAAFGGLVRGFSRVRRGSADWR
jgi:hypothetical protein